MHPAINAGHAWQQAREKWPHSLLCRWTKSGLQDPDGAQLPILVFLFVPSGSCKPDSVHPCGLCGHFSLHLLPDEPCVYSKVQLIPGNTAGRRPFPCLSCIARGFPCLRRYLRSGGLLPHLFTLTLAGGLFSVALSGHPALAPGVSCFHRTRCLMMSGLSSTRWIDPRTAVTRTRTAQLIYNVTGYFASVKCVPACKMRQMRV